MRKRRLLTTLAGAATLVLVGPLLLPTPSVANPASVAELADVDSRFTEIDGVSIHYKMAGEGPLIVLLHGFLGSTENWRKALARLTDHGTVLAYDRPGFGLSGRPSHDEWGDRNPYAPETQTVLLRQLIRALGHDHAILVGSSAGGTVAMQMALESPEMVDALILIAPAVYGGNGAPGWSKPLLSTPQVRRFVFYLVHKWLGGETPDLLSGAYHDPSKVSAEEIERNGRFTRIDGWDRALWDFVLASRHIDLPAQVGDLTLPTLIITGDNDRVVPTKQSLRLAAELPGAALEVVPECGHLPQEECPDETMAAIITFLDDTAVQERQR